MQKNQKVKHTEAFLTYVVIRVWQFKSHSDDDVSQKGLSVLNLLVFLHSNLWPFLVQYIIYQSEWAKMRKFITFRALSLDSALFQRNGQGVCQKGFYSM